MSKQDKRLARRWAIRKEKEMKEKLQIAEFVQQYRQFSKAAEGIIGVIFSGGVR